MSVTITGTTFILPDGVIPGRSLKDAAEILPTQLQQQSLQAFMVPLTSAYVHDAAATRLPGTAASDDLAITTGSFGTAANTIETGDVKNTTTTRRAGFEVFLPHNYEAAETVKFRIRGGMKTTVASASATVDLEVYKSDGDGAVGSDLCATAAQSINSLTANNFDFDITSTSLNPGDHLFIRVTIAVTDSATATAVIGRLTKIDMLCDTRG